jgi:H+/Cl- antiporter ClcA
MYISASVAVVFSFAIVGMIVNKAIINKPFYASLTHLNFIKDEKSNKLLGVTVLRYIILHSFWKFLNPGLKLDKAKGREKLLWLRAEMTNAEISHLIGFVLGLLVILASFVTGYKTGIILPLFIANVLFHLYPALLQQYNKRRVDLLLARYKS